MVTEQVKQSGGGLRDKLLFVHVWFGMNHVQHYGVGPISCIWYQIKLLHLTLKLLHIKKEN